MTELAEQADIITPNLTELCLLTDTDSLTAAELTGQVEAAALSGAQTGGGAM